MDSGEGVTVVRVPSHPATTTNQPPLLWRSAWLRTMLKGWAGRGAPPEHGELGRDVVHRAVPE